jgi:RsmE family RNA methyltransferase
VNLLLLFPEDLSPDGRARLSGRRAQHAREVLRVSLGDALRVGMLGGQVGTATVEAQTSDELVLLPSFVDPPPPRPGVDVLLAIPRPKALKKVLPSLASLGVDRIVLLNAARVEKSYFDSKVVDPGYLRELLVLGLEQAKDTVLPEILVKNRFRPFVEDELEGLFGDSLKLLPHPVASQHFPPPREPAQRVLLAIGPEGGWVPFEVELLSAHGFVPVTLGPRTLRVETVVPYLFGALASGNGLSGR